MGDRGLWGVLGAVPDRRGRKGRRYPLRSLLGISLAAILAGANDLRAIFRWGRRLRPEALVAFGIAHARRLATRPITIFSHRLTGMRWPARLAAVL